MNDMKRRFALLAALAASVIACNPSKDRGDDVYGEAERYEGLSAYSYKYTDSQVGGCDCYGLSIFRGNVGEDIRLDGKGLELYLEMITPSTSSLELPAGTYKAVLKYDGSNPAFMLSTGAVSSGLVYGSYMEFVPSEVADPEYYVLTDGTVTVGKRGGTYVIEANVIVGGEPVIFHYSGSVEALEISGEGGGGDDVETGMDYTFSNFTKGEIDYFGREDGLSFWGIYLGDEYADMDDLSSEGSLLFLEFSTQDASTTALKAGTYTVSSVDGDMTATAMYEVEDGYAGTMYCLEDFIVVGATSGTVKVSRNGSDYTVEADLYDAEFDNTFKGSYTGPLKYVDYSKGNRAVKVRVTSKNLAREGKRHFAVRGRV